MTVFRTPRMDDFNRAVISFDRECHVTDRIAHFDLIKQPVREIGEPSGSIEVEVDLLKKRNRRCHLRAPLHQWLR